MFAALGVGNQMIAVLPKSDIVIVNRANTYRGEGTPMRPLLDLIEQVLDARTGATVADPQLAPLEVGSDPMVTHVANDRLEEFVGEWDYPPSPLGLPSRMTVTFTAGDGHLVGYAPVRGTFNYYLQEDGTLHQEDSHQRFVPVRDDDGSFAGIANADAILTAALTAAAEGSGERAAHLVALAEGDDDVPVEVVRAIVHLLGGDPTSAERGVRELVERTEPRRIELEVNAAGYALLTTQKAEQALAVFELNTRVFPEAFNTWDSLGEAHMVLGNDDEAIRNYERSLELNPDNSNATAMIARIREGAGPPN
jgi:tetratricopeptide (TPR) repeat protein